MLGWMLIFLLPSTTRADSRLLLHQDARVELPRRWEAGLEIETKYRHQMSSYYDLETFPWAYRSPTSWLKLGAGWRTLHVHEERLDVWDVEQRPTADFFLSHALAGWAARDRLRLEDRNIGSRKGFVRLRNYLTATAPWAWTTAAIRPWAGWESYHENGQWDEFRCYGGLKARPARALDAALYYYRDRLIRGGRWDADDVVGLDLSLVFDLARDAR